MRSSVFTVLLALSAATAWPAVQMTLLGPVQFTRSTGKPSLVSTSFSAKRPGTGTVFVKNGTAGGQNRVSSAVIQINGTDVVGPSAFNQNEAEIAVEFPLRAENVLSVQIASSPGGYITVRVVQTVPMEELLINGDFSQGMTSWTQHENTWGGLRTTTIVPSDPPFPNVLEMASQVYEGYGGASAISQTLSVLTSSFSSLVLSADVKAIYASVGNGCGWVGHEFPVRLDVVYDDPSGIEGRVFFGFYFGGGSCGNPTDLGPNMTAHTARVTQNAWFHYVSPDLKTLIPDGSRIKEVWVMGNGWNYLGRADNISLLGVY